MNVDDITVTVQRDCLGGERIVELVLPEPIREAALDRVPGVRSRQVLHGLPRPFFRLDVPGRFLLSGIVGDPRIRFTVRLAARERALELSLQTARALLERDP